MGDHRREPDFSVPEAQSFLLEGGPHGVLLFHGFTGSAAHMRPLGERLHAAGYTVMGVNLPGHALTPEAMGQTGWRDWLTCARETCEEIKERCAVVTAAGLSMGGLLSLILAEEGRVSSAVTISAPMGVQKMPPLALANAASLIKPVIWWKNGGREKLLDQQYDIGYPCFPTHSAADLGRLIGMARNGLNKITCPVLTVQSTGDGLVIPESANIIRDGVRSAIKLDLRVKDVPHTCTVSTALPEIAEAMVDFLRRSTPKR